MNELLRQHTNYLILNWENPHQTVLQPVSFVDNVKTWWNTWINDPKRKEEFANIIRYLLESLDDFIAIVIENNKKLFTQENVAEYNESSTDPIVLEQKSIKDSIIDSFSKLYDSMMTLPLWLKPFSGSIRNLVVGIIAPIVLDFILRKYLKG
jgi:hypothetical protein